MVSWGCALLLVAFAITSKGSRRWALLQPWRYWPPLVTLTLVLPNFTTSAPGPLYTPPQLIFAGVVSLVLYVAFVFVQTVRHRGYFLTDFEEDEVHGVPPSGPVALLSFALLLISLVAVVALAKALTPTIEAGIDRFGAPKAVVGVIIATLVLLPESLAALRAARLNRLQTSMNLALGSALASISLTIPRSLLYRLQ